ncbi:hypothetical protein HYW21_09450 [Candidatus Woesearchaeota archaeon]|nr:hypothetical protein [Candidatus Woesearchaeota archaeon]
MQEGGQQKDLNSFWKINRKIVRGYRKKLHPKKGLAASSQNSMRYMITGVMRGRSLREHSPFTSQVKNFEAANLSGSEFLDGAPKKETYK